ncbi:uncharacterized protein LOC111077380 [Drosophila obscura]|uniref:uncharacterized protein LOC111077380 n=1 Tax=Drosophila obscura TaxID=7282 RepID=UPI001BB218B6|nr:uncharacterized protein LOC111077380 [Drosophila obscura]
MFRIKNVNCWEIKPRRITALDPGNTNITEQLDAFKKHSAEFEKSRAQCPKTLIPLKNKDSVMDVVMKHIESSRSTIVNVDGVRFLCHDVVLSLFSERLKEHMKKDCLHFETPELASRAFDQIYCWMHGECSFVQSFDLSLLRAARFLAIPELLHEMWKLLDKKNLMEYDAFKMMCGSSEIHEILELQKLMVTRISKCTVVIFSSPQYLELSELQVWLLLKSSRLAVNSEMEVFYGALCWLRYKWPMRHASIGKILKSIRYGFMSILMLRKFTLPCRTQTGPFGDILDVFIQLPEFKKILADAMFYSSLLTTTLKQPDCLKERLAVTRMKLLSPRRWMIDARCEYHRPVCATIPNMSFVSWEEYTKYMFMLQNEKTNLDVCISCVDEPDTERAICSASESVQSSFSDLHSSTSSQISELSKDTSTTSLSSSYEDTSDALSQLCLSSSSWESRLTAMDSHAWQRCLTSADDDDELSTSDE